MEQAPKLTRRADYIGIWWTLIGPGGVLVTIFSTIIGFFDPISKHGWAAVILAGFTAAGVAILIASVGLIGWRYFNPISSKSYKITDVDGNNLRMLLDTRLNEFLENRLRPEFATHAQAHVYDEKLAFISDKVHSAQGSAQIAFDHAKNEVKRIEDLVLDLSSRFEKLVAYVEADVRNTGERFRNVDGGFRAIRHREQLAYHAEKIEKLAGEMLSLSAGIPINNWGEWSSKSSRWMAGLSLWLELAENYRDGCRDRVMTVDPEQLKGDWPEGEDQFPSIDAIMAYRKVAVILSQFRFEQAQVDEAIVLAAFHSPSMRGRDYSSAEV